MKKKRKEKGDHSVGLFERQPRVLFLGLPSIFWNSFPSEYAGRNSRGMKEVTECSESPGVDETKYICIYFYFLQGGREVEEGKG